MTELINPGMGRNSRLYIHQVIMDKTLHFIEGTSVNCTYPKPASIKTILVTQPIILTHLL